MASSDPGSRPSNFWFGLLKLGALLAAAAGTFLLVFPVLQPLDFDAEQSYIDLTVFSDSGRWVDAAQIMRRLSEFKGNTRFSSEIWTAWLNQARRYGKANGDWSLLLSLAEKAAGELPGNNIIRAFQVYSRIKAADLNVTPLMNPVGILEKRYAMDYYLVRFFRQQGLGSLYRPLELLSSSESDFWSYMADVMPWNPSYAGRALLTAARERNSQNILKYQRVLSSESLLRSFNKEDARWQRLAGLASFRLGFWQQAASWLEAALRSESSHIGNQTALAEIYYQLGFRLRAREIMRNLERRMDQLPDETVATLRRNLALILFSYGQKEAAVSVLQTNPREEEKQLLLFYKSASESGETARIVREMAEIFRNDEKNLENAYLYFAAFPAMMTSQQLNRLLNQESSNPAGNEWKHGFAEMILWDHNRYGRFQQAINFADAYLAEHPDAWNVVREKALALAQQPGQLETAYNLWTSVPPSEKDFFWEWNAAALSGAAVSVKDGARDYSVALRHNMRAETLLDQSQQNRGMLELRAALLRQRAGWEYLMGNSTAASAIMRTARDLDLTSPDASIQLGRWNEKRGNNETEDARPDQSNP